MAAPDYFAPAAGMLLCFGAIVGRGPQSVAKDLGRPGLGMIAVAACMLSSLMCGGIPALFVAWRMTVWIKNKGPAVAYGGSENYGLSATDVRDAMRGIAPPPEAGPYVTIGHLIVCNTCKKATSKSDGVPPKCPHCGARFGRVKRDDRDDRPKRPARGKRAADSPDDDLIPLQLAEPPEVHPRGTRNRRPDGR